MTVIMTKPDYVKKAQTLLADTTSYQQVAIDPTPQQGNRITHTLKRLMNAGQLTKTGTPSHKLTKDLQQRLKHLVDGSPHSIYSTQDFLDTFKNDKIMVSFDVTALFTSIDIPLAKE
eukprot:g22722.t1